MKKIIQRFCRCIQGVVFIFLYSGLQSDQINIIQAFITEENGGWTATATQLPMTVGNFVCIILTFVYGSLFMKFGVKKPLMVLWGFGVACMTGGVPTLHPCMTSYAYGRKEYQSANRILMAIQLIPYSFAAMMMIALIGAGRSNLAFTILILVIAAGIVSCIMMLKMKDANAADRSYGDKK